MENIVNSMDARGFVLLADYVPGIIQEIRYYSTYNFTGERITGYEEPCAIISREAAHALQAVAGQLNALGYRLKIYDAYRPVSAVKHFALWGLDDLDQRINIRLGMAEIPGLEDNLLSRLKDSHCAFLF